MADFGICENPDCQLSYRSLSLAGLYEVGVAAKFEVKPQSIPDYLAVVGDTADGFPGLPGWGVKAASLTLSRYPLLEGIPKDWRQWHPSIRKARLLSESLFSAWNDALLFRTLATLRLGVPVGRDRARILRTTVGE